MNEIPAGFFKDALDPTEEELRRWAAIEGATYPPEMEQDWDLMVASPERADLILALAGDAACPNRGFFLSCLYLMVGDAVRSEGSTWPLAEISSWLERQEDLADPSISLFRERANALLANPETFNYNLWCWGGHAYGIEELAPDKPDPPRRWWEFWKH